MKSLLLRALGGTSPDADAGTSDDPAASSRVDAGPGGAGPTADTPPRYEVHFEPSTTLEVTGWLRRTDNAPALEPLFLVLPDGGEPIAFELRHRGDLEAAGIANGLAAFRVDVSSRVTPDTVSLACEIAAGEGAARRPIASDIRELPGFPALVADPLLQAETRVSLRHWTVDCERGGGLRIDRFSAPRSLAADVRAYTRIACTEALTPERGLALRTPLDADALGDAPVLKLGLLARADRPTRLRCTVLDASGRALACEHFSLEGDWRRMHRVLCSAEALRAAGGDGLSLELRFLHAGRGHVDLAVCCPSGAPTLHWMRAWLARAERGTHDAAAEASAAPIEHVSNGEFERWSRGVVFDAPVPHGPLCDAWYLEGREGARSAASVRLERISGAAARSRSTDGSPPPYGARVVTGTYEGPMRLTTRVSPAALQEPALDIEFGIEASGERPVEQLRRVMLLARGGEREVVAHVLERWPCVRGNTRFRYRLEEPAMIALRRSCAECPDLFLAFELEQHGDVLLHGVHARAVPAPGAHVERRVLPSLAPAFEDPVIRAQLDGLRGFETWKRPDPLEPARAPRTAGAPQALPDAGVGDIVAPTWQRPYDGYPSADIVVPVYNAFESVVECVRSVLERTRVPYTLLLLDDCSDEDTAGWLAAVAARFPHVQHLRNDDNLGYTRNVNRGLAASTADRVCVLNSDCIVTDGWLERLIDCSLSGPSVGMVGPLSNAASYQSVPRVRNDQGAWDFNAMPVDFDPARIASLVHEHSQRARPDVGVINGFCQLISRALVERIGVLDEQAFPRGFGEENDYCARAVKAGFRLLIADDVYVYHAKSQSFGHAVRKELSALGRTSLHTKHPDVDWKGITSRIESDPALATLRARLLEHGL